MPQVIEPRTVPGLEVTREETRRLIAYIALVGFLVLLLLPILRWAVWDQEIDGAIKMLTTTAGILSGIVGAVIGFYFRQVK